MSLAVANLSGRVIWAAISDRIGTRTTFHLLCLGSVPLFLSIPHLVAGCVSDPSSPMAPLYFAGFCANTFLIVTIMGGVFSCLPPYYCTSGRWRRTGPCINYWRSWIQTCSRRPSVQGLSLPVSYSRVVASHSRDW